MGELMRRFVQEADRGQWTLLPECLRGDVHHAGECPLMGEWRASLANKLNYVA
jgi:hypothetical protein